MSLWCGWFETVLLLNSCGIVSVAYAPSLVEDIETNELQSYTEDVKFKEAKTWLMSMNNEMLSLKKNETWC